MKNSSPKVVMPGIKIEEREQDVAVHTRCGENSGRISEVKSTLATSGSCGVIPRLCASFGVLHWANL